MKRVGICLLFVGALVLASAVVVERLVAHQDPRIPVPSRAKQPAPIIIDYPAEGSIFPPEFPAPTFLWRDAVENATAWLVTVTFGDHSPRIQVQSTGERMRIGEIDARCVTPANEPTLTLQQAAARIWTPDARTWAAIKKHSVKRPATVTICGYLDQFRGEPVSSGQVTIQTSKDPVGAPIFYRDVPLMPGEGEKTVEIDPENTPAYINLAVALAGTGRLDAAIECLENCLAVSPNNAKAHNNLAAALIEQGRTEEAFEHCQRALEIDPEYADARTNLAIVLERSGKLDEAITHLEKAVAIKPDSFEYQSNLGRFLAEKRKFNEAIQHFEQAVTLSGGQEPLSLDFLAEMYSEVGRFQEAVQAARRALDLAVQQNNPDLAADLNAKIAIYEAKRPVREKPPSPPSSTPP